MSIEKWVMNDEYCCVVIWMCYNDVKIMKMGIVYEWTKSGDMTMNMGELGANWEI